VIHDISPRVSPRIAVFPGDTPFARTVALDLAHGDNLTLSAVTTTVHVGAHCDAPSHYHRDGAPIDQRPLDLYLGPAQVVSVHRPGDGSLRIRPENLTTDVKAPRVLLRTCSFPDPERWTGDFLALSPQLVDFLADRSVRLVGIDTPSIDPADDKELLSHAAVYRRDMAVLEGIVLDGVEDGLYTLVALPLRLEGADASPVRAVLLAP
jgi:arylformamidase